MVTILNPPPIIFIVKVEARIGAYRLQLNGNWKLHEHASIIKWIIIPIINMGSDYMMQTIFLHILIDPEGFLGNTRAKNN